MRSSARNRLTNPLRDSDAEFGQWPRMAFASIVPLANQQRPCSMQGGFNGYEAHRGPCHRFADRLGIRHIVLIALHIWLHVSRRHETDIVTTARDLARAQ